MMIDTAKSRQIRRAERQTNSFDWGYRLENGHVPTVSARIEGSDGITYYVSLSDADIKAINEARERYSDQFQPA